MPRLVDHTVRRAELAEALWEVVLTRGIHDVSVRSVAAQAGTSPGALRHYFTSQDELLGFALQSVVDRVTARLGPLLPTLRGRAGAQRILEQFLPLDPERRGETEVYLAFNVRAHLHTGLRAIRDDTETQSRRAVRHALQLLADDHLLGQGRRPATQAHQTYPLVDGLALHGTLWPDRYPPAHLRRTLRAHLDQLSEPLVGRKPGR